MPGSWMTDTTPSLPEAPPKKPAVDLGGFVFTAGGIAHPITQALADDLILKVYAPEDQHTAIAQNLGLS